MDVFVLTSLKKLCYTAVMHATLLRNGLLVSLLISIFCTSPAFGQEHQAREYETAMTKGTFSLETGDFVTAMTFFTKALTVKPADTAAATGLGMAYSGAGNYQKAKEILLKALANAPSDARVRYEIGIVMLKLGESEEARDFFTAVVESHADETLKKAARNYLAIIGAKGEKKGLSLSVSGGLQYDSNVILEPNNPTTASPQRKSDMNGVLMFDGTYRFLKTEQASADVGYGFYQSLHRSLTDFNIQQHNLKLAATRDLSNTAKIGIKYNYGYTLVGGHHFSNSNEINPFITMIFTPKSVTEFHVIYRNEQFSDTSLFPLNDQMSGTDLTGGVLHTIRVGAATTISLAYDFDANDAKENFWSYQGNRGTIGLQHTMSGYTLTASASYYDQEYRGDFPGFTAKRHDGTQEYSVDLSRPLAKHVALSLSDLYSFHDSNLPTFSYTRNIVGLFAVVRL